MNRYIKSIGLILLFSAISFQLRAYEVRTKAPKYRVKSTHYGIASFYHHSLNGFKTYNGERYSDKKMTAAHKTLPMGTMVRVTDLRNHRSVIVRINDRLPKHSKRLIDLSHKAASKLHMISQGLAHVRIEVLK